MDFWGILAVLFSIAFIITLVLPWVNRSNIQLLQNEIKFLKHQLDEILYQLEQKGIVIDENRIKQSKPQAEHFKPIEIRETVQNIETVKEDILVQSHIIREDYTAPPQEDTQKESLSFEQQFGAKLPVWIGAIALALAGFFMVKYSIENNLLSPEVRVLSGILFGCVLLYASSWVRNKPDFANGERISQALAGAGIADLYVCIFASQALYNLVSPVVGFLGLAAVTAIAIVMSVRYGMPIALMGLVGGFLTPAIVNTTSQPQAFTLFFYLYFVLAGLMAVIRQKNWWILSIPTIAGGFLWVILWLLGGLYTPYDTLWLGLFILATTATVIATSNKEYTKNFNAEGIEVIGKPIGLLNYLSMAVSIVLMGAVSAASGFGIMEWGLFALLSIGAIAIAFFRQSLYGFAPCLAFIVNIIMLIAWNVQDETYFASVLLFFAILFSVSGYVLQSRSQKPLLWAGLTAAAALSYYVLAYLSLDNRFFSLPTNLQMIPHFWSGLAFALSLLGCFIVNHLLNAIPSTYGQKQNILALYVGTATAFLSIALSIEIDPQFLPIAFAFQFLALSAIYTKVNIPNIRYFIATLAGLFIICKIAIIFVLIDLFTSAITDTISYLPQSDFNTPKIYYHLIHLGIPALCFLAASYLLRQKDERDSFATWFEKAFIALVAITTYFTVDVIFLKSEQVTSFVERGITTNLFFIYAIGCFMIAQKYNRKAFEYGGYALVGLAALRLGYFEYLLYNPLWTKQSVGIYPLFNWLLFVYALPILFIYYILKIIPQPIQNFVSKCGYGSILLLAFTFVSFNVRQFYHGEFLNAYTTSNIEIYSYSAAWTLLGIGLLFYGTLKQDKMLRIASLIIMLLTIGKVFLYDASELEGLYRVVSFFILGVVLIGLSWFYTKFVFKKS